ncbi:MAG TPA: TetR/AcrR family transcriptional regulator [Solirubrobacteraceae bacterium]|nr:TetR/AcrR family transcriptional regulator [Solirubrobacteraceae bacterium]
MGNSTLTIGSLRPGRGTLSRGQVDGIQRARLLSAMIDIAAEQGFLGASVGRVVERAGISRRTFYELFDSREDCFLAAVEWGVQQAGALMAQAYSQEGSWVTRTRNAIAVLLAFLEAEPELAQVCVVESLGAGTLVLERRAHVLERLAAVLSADAPAKRGGQPPLLTEEGIVGGALSVLHTRLLEQRSARARASGKRAPGSARARTADRSTAEPRVGSLSALLGQLMALIVLPYLGSRAAAEELMRATPAVDKPELVGRRGASQRVLEQLQMRLTYRTVRCLLYVAEHPGASNREIAIGSEIADEGQASKLLTRLAKLELVSKRSPGPGRPNSWSLTAAGQQVLGAIDTP